MMSSQFTAFHYNGLGIREEDGNRKVRYTPVEFTDDDNDDDDVSGSGGGGGDSDWGMMVIDYINWHIL